MEIKYESSSVAYSPGTQGSSSNV